MNRLDNMYKLYNFFFCLHETDNVRHGTNMIEYFLERGYPRQFLLDTYNQVKNFPESPCWKLDMLVFKIALKNQMTKSLLSLLFT